MLRLIGLAATAILTLYGLEHIGVIKAKKYLPNLPRFEDTSKSTQSSFLQPKKSKETVQNKPTSFTNRIATRKTYGVDEVNESAFIKSLPIIK